MKKYNYLFFSMVLIITTLLYYRSIQYGFYNLDDYHITENPYLEDISQIGKAFKKDANRPFGVLISFLLSFFWGITPVSYHILGILLHLLCGIALFILTKELSSLSPSDKQMSPSHFSLFISAAFLLHPLQTETVLYPIQTTSVLPMALSCLLSLTCYIKYRVTNCSRYLFFIIPLTVIAQMSRETAIVLPVLLWLTELLFFSNGDLKLSLKKWYLFACHLVLSFSIFLTCSSFFSYSTILDPKNHGAIPRLTYLITQFAVVTNYIKLSFMPIEQNLDYDFPLFSSLFSAAPLLSLLLLIALLISAIGVRKKKPLFSFGIVWFFLFLLPTSSVVPLKNIMFEHRLYLPLAGIFISFFSLLSPFYKKYTCKFLFITLLFFCQILLLTHLRIPVWKNNLSLWKDVMKKSPGKPRSYNNIGEVLSKEGDNSGAITFFKKAIAVEPKFGLAHFNLGTAFIEDNNFDQAIPHLTHAVNLLEISLQGGAYHNLGFALEQAHRDKEAITSYEQSLAIAPKNLTVHYLLAGLLEKQGNLEKAIKHYQTTLNLQAEGSKKIAEEQIYFNMGKILAKLQKNNAAINHYSKALKINPDLFEVQFNIGLAFAGQKRFREAADHYKKAIVLNSDFAQGHNSLGNALNMMGMVNEAEQHYKKALSIQPAYPQAHYNLGILYKRQGHTKMAKEELNKARELTKVQRRVEN